MIARSLVFLAALATGCNVPTPSKPRGASIPDASAPLDGSVAACDRALVVVESDFQSTNVGLAALDGRVLSASVASSATDSVGLGAPLSKDVVVPSTRVSGDEIVLLDRDPGASRVIWVNPRTARTRELRVGPGFFANPHDYAALSRTRAYVTRYETNPRPGQQPFDRGGDVLIVDPSVPAITGSIDLAPALGDDQARALPRPDVIAVSGSRAFVLLGARPTNFAGSDVPSRVAVVSTETDTVTDVLVLAGFSNCAGLALSPDGDRLAVSCSGTIAQDARSDLATSGIVLVDISKGAPEIARSFPGTALAPGPVGFWSAFATPSVLLFQTFGFRDEGRGTSAPDLLLRLDLGTSRAETVLDGAAFTLGGIACDGGCGVCFVADADRQGGVVQRFAVSADGALSPPDAIKIETDPGLPPRYLGRY